MRRLALLLVVLAGLAVPPAAGAASFTDIEDEVMCVSCNVALHIAEAPQADRQREEIRRLVAQGLSKQEIKDRLVEIYGPNVLGDPPSEGFNVAAWLVPVGALAVLLALAALLLPRWRRSAALAAGTEAGLPAGPALSAADAERLDRDMERWGR